MIHSLPAVLAGVYHDAVALGQAFELGNFFRRAKQMTEQRAIARIALGQRSDVPARHNEHMHRRFRMDVRKGVAELVLVHSSRRDGPLDDLAK